MSPAALAGPRTPATRPRGRVAFVVPLLLAAALGVSVGVAPRPTFLVASGVVAAAVLSLRLEWAACAVVGAAVFDDYLDRVWPASIEVLGLVLVLAWVIRRARGPVGRDRSVPVLVAAGGFLVLLVLAALVHLNGRTGLDVVLRYGGLVLVFAVLVDSLAGPVRHVRLARVFVWSCVLASLCGIVTAAVEARHRVAGPVADPDALALFLLAAIPLAALLPVRRRWHRTAVIAVLVLGMLGTQSQGALAGEAAILLLAVAIRALSLRAAALWLVLIGTVAGFVLAVLPHQVGSRFSDQQRYVEARYSERLTSWETAASMTLHHPVLGLGPGAFALYHLDYQYRPVARDASGRRNLHVAHSTPLQATAELGVPAGLALMAVFVLPLVGARRRWLRLRSRVAVASAVALVGALVTSLLETEQYLLPLWLLAALASPVHTHWRGLPVGSTSVTPVSVER